MAQTETIADLVSRLRADRNAASADDLARYRQAYMAGECEHWRANVKAYIRSGLCASNADVWGVDETDCARRVDLIAARYRSSGYANVVAGKPVRFKP